MAMVTNDMEKTVRFYRDIMGFPLVAAIGGNPSGLRAKHYFFETGPNSTIAFFEWAGAEDFHKPAGLEPAGSNSTTFPSTLRRSTSYLGCRHV
jgi:catechol 2,3-dioxygenase-like lactoylglutathione lyase family enzyme